MYCYFYYFNIKFHAMLLSQLGHQKKLHLSIHVSEDFDHYSISRSEECARKAHICLNGEKLQCGENSVTLYLSYVDSGTRLKHRHPQAEDLPIAYLLFLTVIWLMFIWCVCVLWQSEPRTVCSIHVCLRAVPCEEDVSIPLPEGLVFVEDFVSLEEEALLLDAIDWTSANDDVAGEALLRCALTSLGLNSKSMLNVSFRCAYVTLPCSSKTSEAQKSQTLWLWISLRQQQRG